ncbi:hypothetical protein [Bosea sp. (in: a-proteobacteria)]|uniref:hypothetical protein n=1 Tax=Bosea sp. (in: a-proteobacteria) TaxID=1871050 RepID=UPI0026267D2C|nr:hypothetical protein [Bosea sp. (in: a-proteobacteria)]MCO5091028.1 hypothetical protein [Bosea sp. (in: a-proteobacteria)]
MPISFGHNGIDHRGTAQALIADNDKRRRDTSYTLFSLICTEIWCLPAVQGFGATFETLRPLAMEPTI